MRKLLLETTALLALAAAPAKADVVFHADTFNVIGSTSVVLNAPRSINAQVGEIQLINTTTNQSAFVWCLDVFDGINLPYDYTVSTFTAGDIKPGIVSLDTLQVRQIAALMYLGDHLAGVNKAAIQLAIWETEYEHVGSGFSSQASGSLLATQNTYFNGTLASALWDRSDLTLSVYTDAPINPSQAFGSVQVAAVPEIQTWAMLILGFAGIGSLAMRKRRQNTGTAFRVA